MDVIGGTLYVKVDGILENAKGDWTYNIGADKREAVLGSRGVNGFKLIPQVPFIEGTISDRSDLDLKALTAIKDATVTLELANGKTVIMRKGAFAGDGTASTEEGDIKVRFESVDQLEVIPA